MNLTDGLPTGSYDLRLVALSILIAFIASYTAIGLRNRSPFTPDRGGLGRLVSQTVALGMGIWATHLTGLLAWERLIPDSDISYETLPIVLSVLVAIGASAIALWKSSGRPTKEFPELTIDDWQPLTFSKSGIVLAGAIALSHYILLATSSSMRLTGVIIECNLLRIVVSFTLACGLSALAFCLKDARSNQHDRSPFGEQERRGTLDLFAALLLAAAIACEHYLTQAAFQWIPTEELPAFPLFSLTFDASWPVSSSSIFAAIALAILTVLSLNLLPRSEGDSKDNEVVYSSELNSKTYPTSSPTETRSGEIAQPSPPTIAISYGFNLIAINSAACHLLGVTDREQIIGLSIFEILTTQNPSIVKSQIQNIQEKGRAVELGKLKLNRRDGEKIENVEVMGRPISERGKPAIELILWQQGERQELPEKKAIESPEIQQAHLGAILDIADDAIVSVDERQIIILFNKGAEKIFGYSAKEILGQPLDILLPENVRSSHQQHVRDFSKSGERARKMGDRRQIIARRKDGSEFPAEASISQLILEERKLFTVILRDISDRVRSDEALRQANTALKAEITERERTEQILRESENRYQTLANVAPVGIFHTSADGQCLYVNDRWCKIAGMKHEEALSYGWVQAIHPEDRDRVFREWNEATEANVLFKSEYRFLRPDSVETWVLGWAGADRDENGVLRGYVGTITDISSRKEVEEELHQSREQLELRVQERTSELARANSQLQEESIQRERVAAALRESQERLDGILGSLDDVVWSVSTHTFEILYINAAAERVYGYTVSEFYNNSKLWLELVYPPDRERVAHSNQILTETGSKDLEYRILRPNGEVRWLRDRARLVYDESGTPRRIDGLATDITESKIAEAERQKLVALVENSSDFIGITDLEGKGLFLNQAGCKLIGFNQSKDILSTHMSDFFPEDIWEEVRDTVLPTIQENGYWIGESQLRHFKRGDRIDVQMNLFLVKHPETAEPLCFATVTRDITERKRSERELRESEERFRKIFTEGPLGMCLIGSDYRFLKINTRLCQMLGYSEAELMTLTFADITHPEDIELDIHLVQQLFNGEIPYYTLEKRYLKKNQEIVWINLTACAIRDEKGQLLYGLGIIKDVSERKQYQSAVEKERQQLRQIITHAPVAMAMFDTEMHFLAHSNKWLSDYDLSGKLIIGRSVYDVLKNIPEEWKIIHRRALAGEIITNPEDLFERQDGFKVYLRWAVNPWYGPDGEIGGIVIASDRIDQLVEAREAAIENARLKSQFLANMSHEIRTPMNGVLGMAGLLAKTELDAEQKDFVETIQVSAENLLTIINDILDFSKLEAGEMQLETVDFNLNSCIEDVLELLAAPAHNKGIEVVSWVESDCPRQLQGDAGRLRQVLMNLVGNSIKFTPQGEVVVKAELRSQTSTETYIRISVKDTGIGISPDSQQKLFRSFSQVDASMTRKYGGTGLGLAICKQLVELMGGEIGVESVEGQGSKFWFTARFGKQLAPSEPAIERVPEKSLEGLKLLVVDDNATNRKIVRYQANHWGIQVDEAMSGKEALAKLRIAAAAGNKPYDLAILDMQMPEMDGETLGKQILADSGIGQTQLIMMTSVNLRDDAERLRRAGFANYLIKPVKESRLREVLLNAVNRPRATVTAAVSLERSLLSTKDTSPSDSLSAATKNFKILVVEDNAINQKVMRNQLKRLGYENVATAANGQEALEMLQAVDYNLVFMDCQMPVMDGYSATQEIRQREDSRQHTPIVAMTAHAMKGDREKCLAAGMDDYISKPVDMKQLEDVLQRWSTPSQFGQKSDRSDAIAPHKKQLADFVDCDRLEDVSGGELDFQAELLATFVADSQIALVQLKQALAVGDAIAVQNIAHTLKGSSGNLGVFCVQTTATELERAIRDRHSLDGTAELVERLEQAIEEFHTFISNEP